MVICFFEFLKFKSQVPNANKTNLWDLDLGCLLSDKLQENARVQRMQKRYVLFPTFPYADANLIRFTGYDLSPFY